MNTHTHHSDLTLVLGGTADAIAAFADVATAAAATGVWNGR